MDKMIERILSLLPREMGDALREECTKQASVDEIRFRRDGHVSLTVKGESRRTAVFCRGEALEKLFFALCGGSLYAHADTLTEGFLRFGACRVGVCGRAVTDSGVIRTLTDISSLNIRIPRFLYGIGGELMRFLKEKDFRASLLLYSPPGGGKTTLLRDLALSLGREKRVCLIDSRGELFDAEAMSDTFIDCLSGCPKDKGFSIALRTLSPQFILCDEIGSREDAAALLEAKKSGAEVIATCHAESLRSLLARPLFAVLKDGDVFDAYVGLRRLSDALRLTLTETDRIYGKGG